MVKNKGKEAFARAAHAREENIKRIEQSITEFEKEITSHEKAIYETELKKKLGFKPITPYYEYENTAEWQEYMISVLDESINLRKEKIEESKSLLEGSRKALNQEIARLNLIRQGVPAWEDSVFIKHLNEKEKD